MVCSDSEKVSLDFEESEPILSDVRMNYNS